MKKFLTILLILLCMTTVFVGCTDKEDNPVNNKEEPKKISTLVGKWREKAVPGFGIYPNYEIEITETTISIYMTSANSQNEPWNSSWYERELLWQGTYKNPSEPVENYTFVSIGTGEYAPDLGGGQREFIYADDTLTFVRNNKEYETVPDPDDKVYLVLIDPSLDNETT